MDTPTAVALSRLTAQQRSLDVIANNLANLSTPGFKASRTLFSDWLSRQTGADVPRGGETIAYTQDRATYRDTQAGPLTHTGDPLDLAITGEGFFAVQTPNGTRLTRAGHFGLMADGAIANDAGDALLDANGRPIRLAPTDSVLTVAGDGTLSSENGQLAKIGVVAPSDTMRLVQEGGELLRDDGETPKQVASARIVQGAVEESNVQPVLELTRMMTALREFQFTSQLVQSEADRHQAAIDKLLAQRSS
ncbi:MAG: flagellar basal-body rod protein FlgF [Proteobacteria bacterium]|nr:flagellar basal-body rod protein FlgF [Pseudomonadota bacterium]